MSPVTAALQADSLLLEPPGKPKVVFKMSKKLILKMQESHGQLWEGPLPRVCMCPCGWWASPVEWFAQNLGSSPGLAALVLEWRFRKWSKCIYFCVFVAHLESWCFSLQSHFSMLCSVKPSPLQQLKPAPCPAQQSWGIWGASWGEVGAARRAD